MSVSRRRAAPPGCPPNDCGHDGMQLSRFGLRASDRAECSMTVTFRPIHPEDREFLYTVYASTRDDELAPLPWDETQKTAFLTMQFTAQHTYYQEQFKSAAFEIIL